MNHCDIDSVPMPPRIAARPRTDKGIPVPYVNHVYADGVPDLRVLSAERVNECVDKKLCGICGQALGSEVVFVGGEVSCQNRYFADPAMHEECARYATKVCPYLACQNYHHSKSVKSDEKCTLLVANPLAPPAGSKRPEKMGLYFTTGFKWVIHSGGVKLIKAYTASRIEWF
jgi:hypothetical protein